MRCPEGPPHATRAARYPATRASNPTPAGFRRFRAVLSSPWPPPKVRLPISRIKGQRTPPLLPVQTLSHPGHQTATAGTIKAFRVFGVPVRLHFTFVLLVVFVAVSVLGSA